MAAAFYSTGIRFAPTDADLVLGYLLPCLHGRAPAVDGLVLDHTDPFAAPPGALLHARARTTVDDALFLVLSSKRPLGDTGAWGRQRVTRGTAVSPDSEAVAWRKEAFEHGEAAWVMHRFRVVGAKNGQEMVLCRTKKAEGVKKPKNSEESPSGAVSVAVECSDRPADA